ncbi:PEGA domain-containing protein [bacterium]|nr:PEGA domain-containing protein [candidate division CSSED10-310 bacterium]
MRINLSVVCSVLIFLSASIIGSYADPGQLMSADIIKMHEDGIPSSEIVDSIRTRGLGFAVTLPILEDMIKHGIEQGVLEVLLGHDLSRQVKTLDPSRAQTIPKQPGITISSDPSGLSLFVDGQSFGVTPSLSNKIKPGKHIIKIEHPLFFTRQEEIDFDGINDIYLRWELEPREPIVRVGVNLDRGSDTRPWSWIIRPRSQCPGCKVDLQLQPWQPIARGGEAIFLLDENSKRYFHGSGVTCLEINIWQDEVRRDLPIRQLPPPDLQYFISDIRIDRIEMIDIAINIRIKELDPLHPEIVLQGDSGYLIELNEGGPTTPKPIGNDPFSDMSPVIHP